MHIRGDGTGTGKEEEEKEEVVDGAVTQEEAIAVEVIAAFATLVCCSMENAV